MRFLRDFLSISTLVFVVEAADGVEVRQYLEVVIPCALNSSEA